MQNAERIQIEVVYALPQEQVLLKTAVAAGADVRTGILASGVLERYPQLDIATLEAGIFGKMVRLEEPLRERDRIEIYRPLLADPKLVRQQRAAEGKRLKKGGGKLATEGETGNENGSGEN